MVEHSGGDATGGDDFAVVGERLLALSRGEDEMLGILAQQRVGHKIFGLSFKQVCAEWLELQQRRVTAGEITASRFPTVKTQVQRWILPFFGSQTRIGELTNKSALRFYLYRKESTDNQVQDVTVRNEYTTINSIIRYAFEESYLPFEKMKTPTIKITEPPRRDTFDLDEYRVFVRKIREWVSDAVDDQEVYMRSFIRDFILLKSNSMCRFGELRYLKWGMTKTYSRKKKQRDGTYRSERLVELHLPKEICKNRKSRNIATRGGLYLDRIRTYSEFTKPDDFVFCGRTGVGLAKPTFYKYWWQLMEFSKIQESTKKNFTFYSLRHFAITSRLMAGVSHYDVSKYAGTNVQFIEQHYEHIDYTKMTDDALREASFDEYGHRVDEEDMAPFSGGV